MTRSARLPGNHRSAPTRLLAAEHLGAGDRCVRRLIARRRLPFIKLSAHVHLEHSALAHLIDVGRVPGR